MSSKLAAGVSAGLLTLLLSATRHGLAIANHLQLTGGVTIQDMALFARIAAFGSFVLLFVLPFAVGYAVGNRIDFAREYPSLAAAFGIGGGLGYLIGTAVIVPLTSITPGFLATALLLVGGAVGVAVEVTVVGFAGGALAYLRSRSPGAGVPA